MEFKNNIMEQIGNTPLIKINKLSKGLKPQIYAKLESANPGGSVKDRIGLQMIEDAERNGDLKPGGTIIEATSGNTGIGLAIAASYKGYKAVFVVTDKVSYEKINYLRALGSEVIVVSNAEEPDSPEYYVNVAKRLSEKRSNSLFMYQYSNPSNPEAHYKTTGPEIWRQTDGKITHFIAGIGTGGTISGVGRYLKEKNEDIRIIGSDPYGSIFRHFKKTGEITKGSPYLIEGIGQDCLPENVHFQYIDEIRNVTDRESVDATRLLAKEEGIFAGGSTGTIFHTVLKKAEELSEDDIIVFIVCDTGERYLSKVYNKNWLTEHGLTTIRKSTLNDLVERKNLAGMRELISVTPETLVKDVLKVFHKKGFTQIPVLSDGKAIGCLREAKLSSLVLDDHSVLDAEVHTVTEDCFPVMDYESTLEDVREELKKHQAVLVEKLGRVTNIVTRYDLIDYMSKNE